MTSKSKTASQTENSGDIIDLILEDHKALKKLIKVLKDSEADIGEKYAAFGEFAPLLTLHSKPEEQTLYVDMKEDEELRTEGYEGDVEHALAEQLMLDAQGTTDNEDLWKAKVKVLAELVEHHIEEEEEEMLPEYRKSSEPQKRLELGERFLQIKEQIGMEHPMFTGEATELSQTSIH
jgi:hemerythrin superfamily protein